MTDLRVPGTHHMGPDALFIRHRLSAGPYTSLDPATPANSRLGKAIRSQAGYCLPRRRVPAARRIQTGKSGAFCSASKDGDFTFGVRSNGLRRRSGSIIFGRTDTRHWIRHRPCRRAPPRPLTRLSPEKVCSRHRQLVTCSRRATAAVALGVALRSAAGGFFGPTRRIWRQDAIEGDVCSQERR